MSDFNRVVLAPVELVPILSFRFVLRCALCLALTALNAGVVEYAGAALYRYRRSPTADGWGELVLRGSSRLVGEGLDRRVPRTHRLAP